MSYFERIWESCLQRRILQSKSEFLALLMLIRERNISSIIEIGCCWGGTTIAFQETLRLRTDTTLMSIDTKDHFLRNSESQSFLNEMVTDSYLELGNNKFFLCIGDSCLFHYKNGQYSFLD